MAKAAMNNRLDSQPGTYALLLGLQVPAELQIGRLGQLRFDAPFYLYFGSAFGPGGLQARIKHHLQPLGRAHWHVDYLRQAAKVLDVWYTSDDMRLECIWANTALAIRGTSQVPGFGSSDCRCQSHLFATRKRPNLRDFRRRFDEKQPGCGQIRRMPIMDMQ
jgi:Uri superfamily endonuclease